MLQMDVVKVVKRFKCVCIGWGLLPPLRKKILHITVGAWRCLPFYQIKKIEKENGKY